MNSQYAQCSSSHHNTHSIANWFKILSVQLITLQSKRRGLYRQLRHRKSAEYWYRKIDADKQIHDDCGSQWTVFWAVAACQRVMWLMLKPSIGVFAEKVSKVRSSTSDATCRHSAAFNPASCLRPSRRRRLMSMTSLTLFGSYPTSRQPPIRCRRLFWSKSSTWLHHTSPTSCHL